MGRDGVSVGHGCSGRLTTGYQKESSDQNHDELQGMVVHAADYNRPWMGDNPCCSGVDSIYGASEVKRMIIGLRLVSA